MAQDTNQELQRHQRFIEEVTDTSIVWCLESKEEGLATTTSLDFVDEEGGEISLVCFWSAQDMAANSGAKHWPNYEVVEMSLATFLENWCIGLFVDVCFIGTNLDDELFGQENHPLKLLLEISTVLQQKNKDLSFTKYSSLQDLTEHVQTYYDEPTEEEE